MASWLRDEPLNRSRHQSKISSRAPFSTMRYPQLQRKVDEPGSPLGAQWREKLDDQNPFQFSSVFLWSWDPPQEEHFLKKCERARVTNHSRWCAYYPSAPGFGSSTWVMAPKAHGCVLHGSNPKTPRFPAAPPAATLAASAIR